MAIIDARQALLSTYHMISFNSFVLHECGQGGNLARPLITSVVPALQSLCDDSGSPPRLVSICKSALTWRHSGSNKMLT